MHDHDGTVVHAHVAQADTNDVHKNILGSHNATLSKTAFHLHGDKADRRDQNILPTYLSSNSLKFIERFTGVATFHPSPKSH
jgi:hypothetical protein